MRILKLLLGPHGTFELQSVTPGNQVSDSCGSSSAPPPIHLSLQGRKPQNCDLGRSVALNQWITICINYQNCDWDIYDCAVFLLFRVLSSVSKLKKSLIPSAVMVLSKVWVAERFFLKLQTAVPPKYVYSTQYTHTSERYLTLWTEPVALGLSW